jgi:hypothetical protein
MGLVTAAFPLLCAIPLLWFRLVPVQAVVLGVLHVSVLAPLALVMGALLARLLETPRSWKVFLPSLLALAWLCVPAVLVYSWLYANRPAPVSSWAGGLWQLMVFCGFLGLLNIGGARFGFGEARFTEVRSGEAKPQEAPAQPPTPQPVQPSTPEIPKVNSTDPSK